LFDRNPVDLFPPPPYENLFHFLPQTAKLPSSHFPVPLTFFPLGRGYFRFSSSQVPFITCRTRIVPSSGRLPKSCLTQQKHTRSFFLSILPIFNLRIRSVWLGFLSFSPLLYIQHFSLWRGQRTRKSAPFFFLVFRTTFLPPVKSTFFSYNAPPFQCYIVVFSFFFLCISFTTRPLNIVNCQTCPPPKTDFLFFFVGLCFFLYLLVVHSP